MQAVLRHFRRGPAGSWKPFLHRAPALLLALAVAAAGLATAPPAEAYPDTSVCFLVSDGGDRLVRVDRSTGVETPIGSGIGVPNVETVAFLPSTDTLYASNQNGGTGEFGTIDLTTGVFSLIGTHGSASGVQGTISIDDVDGLTFDPFTFTLYGSVRRPSNPDLLVIIDRTTGDVVDDAFGPGVDYVEIPPVLGRPDIDDIAIDAYDGQMYGIANDGGVTEDLLVKIDRTTGATTLVGALGIDDMEGLGFYNDGSLFGSTGTAAGGDSNKLWDVNKLTGVASNGRPLTVGTDYEANDCLVGPPNTITGTTFLDRNANAVYGPPDAPTSGVRAYLYRDVNANGTYEAGTDRYIGPQTTNGSGAYQFRFASTGAFVLRVDPADLPAGHVFTTDNLEAADFGTNTGQTDAGNDFGWVYPAADLRLTKTVDDSTPDYGDQVTFTITVTNDGPTAATGVEVSDVLPAGLSFDSAAASQGGYDSGTGIWTVGGLASTGSASLTITATVSATGSITNVAQVSASDNYDPDSKPGNGLLSEDDQDDEALTVPPAVDLVVTKDVDDPNPAETDTIVYTVTVANNGPDTATGVVLSDLLPAGVTYVSHIGDGTYVQATGVWTVGTVAASSSASLDITATVDAGTNTQTITNTATVTAVDQYERSPGDESDDAGIDVFQPVVIGDRVWIDTDGDGIQDAGETAGGAGVTVELIDPGTDLAPGGGDDTVVDTTTTGATGAYSLTGDPATSYFVRFTGLPPGYLISPALAGGDPAADSDADPASGATAVFSTVADDDTHDLGLLPAASLSGFVFGDADNDGVFDGGESGIGGVSVTLSGADDLGPITPVVVSTSAGGAYGFPGLRPGTYTISESQPVGWLDGKDTVGSQGGSVGADAFTVTIGAGTVGTGNNFGELAPASLAGSVFADADNDGIFDGAESGIGGVTVTLSGSDDLGSITPVAVTTAADGSYSFGDLRPGTYTITETQPGLFFDGSDTAGTLGGTVGNDVVSGIGVAAGATGTGYLFGELPASSLAGRVFDDTDLDGAFDATEPGIGGVAISVEGTDDLGNPVSVSTTTNPDGTWTVGPLRPSNPAGYTITETQPGGFFDGPDTAGTAGGTAGNDVISAVVLGADTAATGYLFAEIGEVTLSGSVFADTDNDGVFDPTEAGIDGVTVTLTGTDHLTNPVSLTTTTDPDGDYVFPGLRPGTYTLTETQPAGWLDGTDTAGTLAGTVANDQISAIVAAPSATGTGYTFAELAPATLSGSVFSDTDNDGTFDPTEAGIDGVTVTLTGTNDQGPITPIAATTDPDGDYTFPNLRPGTYTITETQPSGWLDGLDTAGPLAGTVTNDQISAITITAGQTGPGNTFAELAPATLSGSVFSDTNNDGTFDPTEAGIDGVTITLTGTNDQGPITPIALTTNPDGDYTFPDLRPGTYTLTETQPAGWYDGTDTIGTQGGTTGPDTFTTTITPGTTGTGNNYAELAPATIGDFVWLDVDDDGVQDPVAGVDGVTVNLYDAGGTLLDTTVTAGGGAYQFADLAPFVPYTVEVVPPTGAVFTTLPGNDDTDDSDVGADGRVAVTPLPGANLDAADAGLVPASIDGVVWFDVDADGLLDPAETRLTGVTVNLYDGSGTLLDTTSTGAGGAYAFGGLPAGDYEIQVVYPDAAYPAPGADSDVDPGTGRVAVTLGSGTTSGASDAGILPAVIGDLVWLDLDEDGLQDPTEPGLDGLTVELLDGGGSTVASATTAGGGAYEFRVLPGDYLVSVTPPPYGSFTVTGGAAADDSDVDAAGDTVLFTAPSGSHTDRGDAGVLPADISGTVWLDLSSDGVLDGGEPRMDGLTVNLYDGSLVATATTAAGGTYAFSGLPPGDYTVEVVPPAGGAFTTGPDSDVDPADGTALVAAGGSHVVDAGLLPASISGVVWLDLDGDGVEDPGEPGATAVDVELLDSGGSVVATMTTDGSGNYGFGPLAGGDYTVRVDPAGLPAGSVQTGDPDTTIDGETAVTVGVSETVTGLDFGYRPPADVTGVVFEDLNGDGVLSPGESGIDGVDVVVTHSGGSLVVGTSGGGLFGATVNPGSVTVDVVDATIPPGIALTTANDPQTFAAPAGATTAAGAIGYGPLAPVSGRVWFDVDADTTRDGGEPDLSAVTVRLVCAGPDGTLGTGDDLAFVDDLTADGAYSFAGVPAQTCRVSVDPASLPSGIVSPTFDVAGPADATAVVSVPPTGLTGVDFGFTGAGSMAGTLWLDLDGDGVFDAGEPVLAAARVTVTWLGPDGVPGGGDDLAYPVVTDGSGRYSLQHLPAGTFQLAVDTASLPVGVAQTFAAATTVTLAVSETRTGLDFGYQPQVDLTVAILPDVQVVAVDDVVTWTVTVGNNGPSTDPGPITVTVSLPGDLTYAGSPPSAWSPAVTTGGVVFTYDGPMADGDVLTFTFDTTVTGLGDLGVAIGVGGAALEANPVDNATVSGLGIQASAALPPSSALLPRTGLETERLWQLALALLLAGAMLILATRRKDEPGS